jgi:hypothetical protein
MVVWGGLAGPDTRFSDGAAYNPRTDVWRLLTDAPTARDDHLAFWTGTEMIVWGGNGADGTPVVEAAAYNPMHDSWRELPRSGLPLAPATGVWTGAELIVTVYPDDDAASTAAYDPIANTWRPVLHTPLDPLWMPQATWTGNEVVYLSREPEDGDLPMTNAAYNPETQTWRPVAAQPPGGFSLDHPVWTGAEIVAYGHEPAAYEPTQDKWRRLASLQAGGIGREGESVVWAGDRLIVWGGGPGNGVGTAEGFALLGLGP